MAKRTLVRTLFWHFVAPAAVSAFVAASGLIYSKFDVTKTLVTFGLLASLVHLVRIVHHVLFSTLEFEGDEEKDAYLIKKAPPGMTKQEAVADMRRSRKIGDNMPPVYPNGWFVVFRSNQIKEKETKYAHVLGLHLAVFRGESGRPYIVDAYCPHLGANLSVGGKVEGECLECPFHGWTFRGEDGKCVKIGYTDKVPEFAKVATYRCLEVHGMIMIWYHAEGEEPTWYPPEIEKVKAGGWVVDESWCAYFDCHIQDFFENSADVAHLNYVHGPQIFSKNYTATWEPHPTKKYLCTALSDWKPNESSWFNIFGDIKLGTNRQHQYGPGLYYIDVENEFFMIIAAIPVAPLRLKMTGIKFSPGINVVNRLMLRLTNFCAALFVVNGDIPIWANKTYMAKPLLVKEDQTITKHRRWYSQFYSEHSPRYKPEDPLQW